jgi:hypothetical protein
VFASCNTTISLVYFLPTPLVEASKSLKTIPAQPNLAVPLNPISSSCFARSCEDLPTFWAWMLKTA